MEAAFDGVPGDMEALRAAFLALRSEAAGLEIEDARLAAENTFLDVEPEAGPLRGQAEAPAPWQELREART